MLLKLNAAIGSPHPDAKADEVFICYVNAAGYLDIGWQTKRKGSKVIGDDGTDITGRPECADIFPVFAQKLELAPQYTSH